jgi:segregation and condensation protein A
MTSLPWVRAGEFEGPLDLLLEEVRRQQVAIEDLTMAPLVARYLDYVATAAGRNLNLDIEWLHLAATLIQWKSRSLLSGEQQKPDPVRDDLVRQLVAHHKDLAEDLARRREQERQRFSRSGSDDPLQEAVEAEPAGEEESFVSVWDLMQQARDLARWATAYRSEQAEQRRYAYSVAAEEVTLGQMSSLLLERLAAAPRLDLTALLLEQTGPDQRNTLFPAALELARGQAVILEQAGVFAQIFADLPTSIV